MNTANKLLQSKLCGPAHWGHGNRVRIPVLAKHSDFIGGIMNFELWFDPTVNSYCLLQESNLNYQFLISNSVKVADFIAKYVDDAIIQRDRFLQWCP